MSLGLSSRRPLLLGAVAAGVVICLAGGATVTWAEGVTAAMRAEDARLEKRVTLLLPRCTIQEAVQALREQTGVELIAPSEKSVSKAYGEDRLCVLLRDVPLGEALDALYSLMSYRGATWEWRRSEETVSGAPLTYTLRRSRGGLEGIGETIATQAQADYEAQARLLEKTLRLPVERQKQIGATNFDVGAMFYKDPAIASRKRGGLETFFSALSPEQRLSVLRGATISIPYDDLPEVGKKFARETWNAAEKFNNPPAPLPPNVDFYTRRQKRISPTLVIDPVGYSYIGNQIEEARQRKKVAAIWMLRDDVSPADADTLMVNKPPKTVPFPSSEAVSKEAYNDPDELAQFFWRVGEGAKVSVMAVLPPRTGGSTFFMTPPVTQLPPYGKTLDNLLTELDQYPYWVDHKWRGNVLLLRDAAAPFVSARSPQPIPAPPTKTTISAAP